MGAFVDCVFIIVLRVRQMLSLSLLLTNLTKKSSLCIGWEYVNTQSSFSYLFCLKFTSNSRVVV